MILLESNMRTQIITCLLLVFLASCTPATTAAPQTSFQIEVENRDDFKVLISPFIKDLQNMGIEITEFQMYRYEGEEPSAFIQATNEFYLSNPGFCPLDEGAGFFVAESGVVFLTLASNNTTSIRGFLYDQSHRPKLKYAYFSGNASVDVASIICETASVSP
jgi:hypothetical protein